MRISTLLILLFFSERSSAQCVAEIFMNYGDCYNNCSGSANVYASGVPPYSYNWSNGATTSSVNNLCRDSTYVITMTDNVGCVAMDTVTIPYDTMFFSSSPTNASCSTCCDGTDTVTVATYNPPPCDQYSYQWYPGSGFPSSTPYNSGMCAGTYTVVVSTNCGCYYGASVTIGVNTVTDIEENVEPELIFSQDYDQLTVSSKEIINGIEVMDVKGSVVARSDETILNTGSFVKGIYFVAVLTSKTRTVRKILIK